MPRISSRISLSILAAVTGGALTYLLIAWGLIPPPVSGLSTLAQITGSLSIILLGSGWIMIFMRRPEWRKSAAKAEKERRKQEAEAKKG
ncbi:MAG: hypothetical protein ACPGO3_13780 [Magnetospiraceae bacterium]